MKFRERQFAYARLMLLPGVIWSSSCQQSLRTPDRNPCDKPPDGAGTMERCVFAWHIQF